MDKSRKAVFLDRDGTLNSDEGHYYIWKKEDIVFNPGVFEALKKLQDNGFLLFVVTNQGGVAKQIYTEKQVEEVHQYMQEEFARQGISIRKFYFCPHHESVVACACRKPSPFMINQAIDEFKLDRSQCFLIGDGDRDIEAAEAAGIKGYKIPKNSNLIPVADTILVAAISDKQ